NYVRDPELAQVHIFVVRINTAGGSRFTLNFIGKQLFEEVNNTLTYTSVNTQTDQEIQEDLVKKIRIGLVTYLAHTDLAEQITVNVPQAGPKRAKPVATEEDDPWDFWLFEVYANGNLSLQSQRTTANIWSGVEAERVTDEYRIRLRPYYNLRNQTIKRDSLDPLVSQVVRYGFNGSVVKSLGDHWSAGVFHNALTDNFQNINWGTSLGPAVEYNFFPYDEVARREFTIAYRTGYLYRDYLEETLYGRLDEHLWNQSLSVDLRIREPWGAIFAGLRGSHFFHDFSKNRLAFNSRVNWRVFKGLNMNVRGDFALINDQLNLPKGDASLEDILLAQTQLATNYNVFLSAGL
ncbi:MAG: hypothetical protein AAGM67_18285, partial [Bacteroidota bacterium]